MESGSKKFILSYSLQHQKPHVPGLGSIGLSPCGPRSGSIYQLEPNFGSQPKPGHESEPKKTWFFIQIRNTRCNEESSNLSIPLPNTTLDHLNPRFLPCN